MPVTGQLLPGVKTFTPYEVDNSIRYDDGSGDSLTRSQSSSPSSQRIFTFD